MEPICSDTNKKALDAVWLSFFIAIFAKSIGGLCSQNFGPLAHIAVFAITTDKTDDIRIMNQTDIALQIAIQAEFLNKWPREYEQNPVHDCMDRERGLFH